MSKKSSRSKKGDGNVPNFVFSLEGSASPSLSGFGGSAPASPTIGSPSLSFQLGSGSVPGSPTSTSFRLNKPDNSSSPFATSKSFDNSSSVSNTNILRRSQSDNDFSIAPSPSSFTPLTTQASSGSLSSQSSFSLVSAPASTPGSFTFSSPSSTTTNPPVTMGSNSLQSNLPNSDTSVSTSTNTTAVNNPPATTSTPTSTFSFGPSTKSEAPKTNSTPPTFSFGQPAKTETKTNPTLPTFSFGSSTPKTETPTTTTTDTSKAPTLTSGFTLSKPTTTSSTSSTPIPSFNFGSKTTPTTTTTTTTTSTSTTIPKFTFGNDKEKTTTTSSSTFTFGSTPSTSATSTPGSTVTSSPFTFSSTPATTNTIAPPTEPNPFSFDKILEDLAKIAAQPPTQINVSLIAPILAGLQQNQVVHHTNFRIDNIMPSTRFTELPEQAQRELDTLEKYIRQEGQRCDYIRQQKFPQHLTAMSRAKKETDVLSQQLDTLSSTLKGQLEQIESLYDEVKEHLRHANDGCAVLEACKHPGQGPRWLFGYSKDDDYFSQLTKQLNGRLEEYKKYIWEIERTVESWSQNKVQSPQDIAHIMRAQNQAFLALSNKVAALHENVHMEKNYYQQFLRTL
ncbi:hypothetical protein EDC96DRAFT_532101 [Choanephora cucurbitarum]|nr:hypothetical protein EDC96DRAFT_532101 [Choanephora cucurbitarum]